MPYVKISLKTAKPKPYPANPQTLGEHIRKRRGELGLMQKEAAEIMGVNQWTLIGWAHDRVEPPVRLWPRIIKFLGYYPSVPRSIGEQLLARRRCFGIRRKEKAKRIGVDETTLAKWETGTGSPKPESLNHIIRFLTDSS